MFFKFCSMESRKFSYVQRNRDVYPLYRLNGNFQPVTISRLSFSHPLSGSLSLSSHSLSSSSPNREQFRVLLIIWLAEKWFESILYISGMNQTTPLTKCSKLFQCNTHFHGEKSIRKAIHSLRIVWMIQFKHFVSRACSVSMLSIFFLSFSIPFLFIF